MNYFLLIAGLVLLGIVIYKYPSLHRGAILARIFQSPDWETGYALVQKHWPMIQKHRFSRACCWFIKDKVELDILKSLGEAQASQSDLQPTIRFLTLLNRLATIALSDRRYHVNDDPASSVREGIKNAFDDQSFLMAVARQARSTAWMKSMDEQVQLIKCHLMQGPKKIITIGTALGIPDLSRDMVMVFAAMHHFTDSDEVYNRFSPSEQKAILHATTRNHGYYNEDEEDVVRTVHQYFLKESMFA